MGAAAAAVFLSAAPALSHTCGEKVSAYCLKTLGAGAAAPVPPDCQAQLGDYRACLTAAAAEPSGQGGMVQRGVGCPPEREDRVWAEVEEDGTCLSYAAFLQACPGSALAPIAAARRKALGCDAAAASSPAARRVQSAPAGPAQTEPAPKAPAPKAPAPKAPAPKAPAQRAPGGRCFAVGRRLTGQIEVRRGSRLCAAADAAKRLVVEAVVRNGVRFSNGPLGSFTCREGDVCGVHWSVQLQFRVSVPPGQREIAILEPAP